MGSCFCFAAKYIYVGFRPGVYYEHCIQRNWIRKIKETPEPAFAGTAFLFGTYFAASVSFPVLLSYFVPKILSPASPTPDLGRWKRFHLTGDRDGRHRSGNVRMGFVKAFQTFRSGDDMNLMFLPPCSLMKSTAATAEPVASMGSVTTMVLCSMGFEAAVVLVRLV